MIHYCYCLMVSGRSIIWYRKILFFLEICFSYGDVCGLICKNLPCPQKFQATRLLSCCNLVFSNSQSNWQFQSLIQQMFLFISQQQKTMSCLKVRHVLSVPLILECVHPSLFSSTLIASLMMFCVRFLSKLMILISSYPVANHLTCRNKLRQPISCTLNLHI